MREKYGLCSWWNVSNNCFVARSPDYEVCWGRGSTHAEAVAALDDDVQEWIRTGRELGVDVSYAQPISSEASPESQEVAPEKPKQEAQHPPLEAFRKALEAAQEAAAAHPLDFTVTLDPCVIHVRGEMTLSPAWTLRHDHARPFLSRRGDSNLSGGQDGGFIRDIRRRLGIRSDMIGFMDESGCVGFQFHRHSSLLRSHAGFVRERGRGGESWGVPCRLAKNSMLRCLGKTCRKSARAWAIIPTRP